MVLLSLRILIRSASKKKIRPWNAKYFAANALDIFTLCTFPDVVNIQRVACPKHFVGVLQKTFPIIPQCSRRSGCWAERQRGPAVTLLWPRSVCTPRLATGRHPPPPLLTAAPPHQVQVFPRFMAVQCMLFPAPAHQPTWIFNKLSVAEVVLLFRTLLSVTMKQFSGIARNN